MGREGMGKEGEMHEERLLLLLLLLHPSHL